MPLGKYTLSLPNKVELVKSLKSQLAQFAPKTSWDIT